MLKHGLLHVYTGTGKGKTTAAVGLAVRARGAGLRVCFIQFVKGGEPSSELAALRALEIAVLRPAVAPTGLLRSGITEDDRRAAADAWAQAAQAIASGAWDLVVLDELHSAVKYHLVDLAAVLEILAQRPTHVEVVTTGRNAPEALCAMADYVSEITSVKHPFQAGIAARKGIEF